MPVTSTPPWSIAYLKSAAVSVTFNSLQTLLHRIWSVRTGIPHDTGTLYLYKYLYMYRCTVPPCICTAHIHVFYLFTYWVRVLSTYSTQHICRRALLYIFTASTLLLKLYGRTVQSTSILLVLYRYVQVYMYRFEKQVEYHVIPGSSTTYSLLILYRVVVLLVQYL